MTSIANQDAAVTQAQKAADDALKAAKRLPLSERASLIRTLRAGVVPLTGVHLIQVGRAREVKSLVADMERMSKGGSTFRVLVGSYGSGKTFFMNLVQSMALQMNMAVISGDLSPERRLYSTTGKARALYAEMMRNFTIKERPQGGGLQLIMDSFAREIIKNAEKNNVTTDQEVSNHLKPLLEMVEGFEFVDVLKAYASASDTGDEELKTSIMRWLRGEYDTKTDARMAVGLRDYISDSSVYDHMKLMAKFLRIQGRGGLLVCMDEMVNLYKMINEGSRNANYEQVLRMLNDTLQGRAEGLGFLMAGTPDAIYDRQRGAFSYAALASRLSQNVFAVNGKVDFNATVIQLDSLTPEELYVLLQKIRQVFAFESKNRRQVPDEAIEAFLKVCAHRIGEGFYRTPRTTITLFLDLLSTMDQNPDSTWQTLLNSIEVEADPPKAVA